jgi:hypothetical protein
MRAVLPTRVQRRVLGTVQAFAQRGPPEDPLVSANNFLESFEEAYGTLHPPFLMTSYRDALKASSDQFKFLVVYLHSADAQVFRFRTTPHALFGHKHATLG